jgi:hypothetical protein
MRTGGRGFSNRGGRDFGGRPQFGRGGGSPMVMMMGNGRGFGRSGGPMTMGGPDFYRNGRMDGDVEAKQSRSDDEAYRGRYE